MKNKQIIVIGAGAAGVIAALTLQRLGYQPIVIHSGIFKPVPFLETIPAQSISLFKKLGIDTLLLHPKHEKNFGQIYKWHQQDWSERNSIYEHQGYGYTIHTPTLNQQLLELLSLSNIEIQIHKVTQIYFDKKSKKWTLELDHRLQLENIDFVIDCTAKNNVLQKALEHKRVCLDQLFGRSLLIETEVPHRLFQQSYVENQQSYWNFFLPYQHKQLYIQHFHHSAEQLKGLNSETIIQKFLNFNQVNSNYQIIFKQNFSTEVAFHPTLAAYYHILAGDAALSFNPISSYGRSFACGSGYYAAMACHEILSTNNRIEAIQSYQQLMMSHMQQHMTQLDFLYQDLTF